MTSILVLTSVSMATLTIKDVPDAWAEALRQRAARNHRSLQGELMALVEKAVIETGTGGPPPPPALAIQSCAMETELWKR